MNAKLPLSLIIGAVLWCAPGAVDARPSGTTRIIACAPSNPDTAAALVASRIWTTVDGGHSWRAFARVQARPEALPQDDSAEDEALVDATAQDMTLTPEDSELPALQEATVTTPPAESLAVSDDGCFAFSAGEGIVLGCHHSHPRKVVDLRGARDLAFDVRGNLWVITGEGLVLYRDPLGDRQRREFWHLADPFDLVQGPPGKGIIALDRNGITQIDVDKDGSGPGKRIFVSGIDAAAFERSPAEGFPEEAALIVAAYGKLTRRSHDEVVEVIGEAPRNTKALLVNQNGEIRFLTAGGTWSEKGHGAFRPVRASALAVDAAGRFWRGTDDGPLRPRDGAPAPELRLNSYPNTPHPVVFTPAPRGQELPRPPRCRRVELSPLPRLNAVAGYRTGLHQFRGRDPVDDQGTLRREAFVGVTLDWRWRRRDPSSCRRRFERYHAERARQNERHAFLASALMRRLVSPESHRDLRAAIAEAIERDRLSHLVGIETNLNPEKEIK